MRSRHITSRRWLTSLVTLLAVVTSQLQPGSGYQLPGHHNAAICHVSCCTAQPNCQQVKTISCSCPYTEQMNLTADFIPASVKSVSISGLSSLTIDKDALLRLHFLTSFSLNDMDSVFVEKGGLNLHNTSRYSIKVNQVGFLHIDSYSFTGDWKDTTSVVLENINRLQIAERGFSYTAPFLGPTVKIQNVKMLELASTAFSALINQLELNDINMQECRWGTFNEKIDTLKLNHVTIAKVKTGCFHRSGELRTSGRIVTIKHSTLHVVHSQGFSGNITGLRLQNTEIGAVRRFGFQAHVKDFLLDNCRIGTLNSAGLSISATHTLSVTHVNVEHLLKNALLGLRISPRSHIRAINLDHVEVQQAELGSLSLPRCQLTDVSRLNVQDADFERCPTEKFARRLVGADDHRELYPAEFKVFLSLRNGHPCGEMEGTIPKRVDEDKECPSPSDEGIAGNETGEDMKAEDKRNRDIKKGENNYEDPDEKGSLEGEGTNTSQGDNKWRGAFITLACAVVVVLVVIAAVYLRLRAQNGGSQQRIWMRIQNRGRSLQRNKRGKSGVPAEEEAIRLEESDTAVSESMKSQMSILSEMQGTRKRNSPNSSPGTSPTAS